MDPVGRRAGTGVGAGTERITGQGQRRHQARKLPQPATRPPPPCQAGTGGHTAAHHAMQPGSCGTPTNRAAEARLPRPCTSCRLRTTMPLAVPTVLQVAAPSAMTHAGHGAVPRLQQRPRVVCRGRASALASLTSLSQCTAPTCCPAGCPGRGLDGRPRAHARTQRQRSATAAAGFRAPAAHDAAAALRSDGPAWLPCPPTRAGGTKVWGGDAPLTSGSPMLRGERVYWALGGSRQCRPQPCSSRSSSTAALQSCSPLGQRPTPDFAYNAIIICVMRPTR